MVEGIRLRRSRRKRRYCRVSPTGGFAEMRRQRTAEPTRSVLRENTTGDPLKREPPARSQAVPDQIVSAGYDLDV